MKDIYNIDKRLEEVVRRIDRCKKISKRNKEILMNRVMIFIDGSNLYNGLKNHIGITSIVIGKFSEILYKSLPKAKFEETRLYTAPLNRTELPEDYKNQQRFFQHIRDTPKHKLILGRLAKRPLRQIVCHGCKKKVTFQLQCPNCNTKIYKRNVEEGVDVCLAIDLLNGGI